jgi:hypothetical protein
MGPFLVFISDENPIQIEWKRVYFLHVIWDPVLQEYLAAESPLIPGLSLKLWPIKLIALRSEVNQRKNGEKRLGVRWSPTNLFCLDILFTPAACIYPPHNSGMTETSRAISLIFRLKEYVI